MTQVSAIDAAATQASQAVQAGQANTEAGNATKAQSDVSKLGLPPVGLARAASANTVNAALVSSQWGLDPGSVGGVYGGAGASASAGLFAGDNLLPLLQSLSPATAERALSLIGITTPAPGGSGGSGGSGSTAAATAQAASQASQAFLDQAAAGSQPMVVDPLWGKTA
jgi:hypothetical protein